MKNSKTSGTRCAKREQESRSIEHPKLFEKRPYMRTNLSPKNGFHFLRTNEMGEDNFPWTNEQTTQTSKCWDFPGFFLFIGIYKFISLLGLLITIVDLSTYIICFFIVINSQWLDRTEISQQKHQKWKKLRFYHSYFFHWNTLVSTDDLS